MSCQWFGANGSPHDDKRYDLGQQGHRRADDRLAFAAGVAPTEIASGSRDRSEMRAMSISRFGRASRMAMSATTL
jgi:hypothetical protein